MTRDQAFALAAERGHDLKPLTSEGTRVEINRCARCDARLVFYELSIYGRALSVSCGRPVLGGVA